MITKLEKVLEHNRQFVESKGYLPLLTSKYPDSRIAILTCMDTRLVELLPAAMGYRNGEVMILKNAGGIVSHPFGSVIRSLIVAIYELGVDTIWVVGHDDCGMESMDVDKLLAKMSDRGIPRSMIELMPRCGVDYKKWLGGFDCPEESVHETIEVISTHPLIPANITVVGLVVDPLTGELRQVK